jgi:hypothetical protein
MAMQWKYQTKNKIKYKAVLPALAKIRAAVYYQRQTELNAISLHLF